MTESFDASQSTDDTTDDVNADYEAARAAEEGDSGLGAEDTSGEQTEGDDKAKAELEGVDKVKENLRERANAARRERQARIAAEERASALEARLAALEGGKQDDPLSALRDDETDPIGDLEALKRFARAEAEQRTKNAQETAAAQQQQRNVQVLSNWAADHEADMRLEKPDYDQAAEFVRDSRLKELEAIHGSKPAAQQALMQELLGVVARCRADNRDPAEVIYTLAQTRGYKNAAIVDNAEQKLQTVRRGQQASRTLSGGKADSSELTIESINRMPSDQRYAAYQKLRAQEMQREARGA